MPDTITKMATSSEVECVLRNLPGIDTCDHRFIRMIDMCTRPPYVTLVSKFKPYKEAMDVGGRIHLIEGAGVVAYDISEPYFGRRFKLNPFEGFIACKTKLKLVYFEEISFDMSKTLWDNYLENHYALNPHHPEWYTKKRMDKLVDELEVKEIVVHNHIAVEMAIDLFVSALRLPRIKTISQAIDEVHKWVEAEKFSRYKSHLIEWFKIILAVFEDERISETPKLIENFSWRDPELIKSEFLKIGVTPDKIVSFITFVCYLDPFIAMNIVKYLGRTFKSIRGCANEIKIHQLSVELLLGSEHDMDKSEVRMFLAYYLKWGLGHDGNIYTNQILDATLFGLREQIGRAHV